MATEQDIINFLNAWRANNVQNGIPRYGKLNEAQLGQLAQELSAWIDQVPIDPPPGKTTLVAYSDVIGDVKGQDVAKGMTEGTSRYFADDLPTTKLFSDAVEKALTRATGDASLTERLRLGTRIEGSPRSPIGAGGILSMADQVSQRIMLGASGDVLVAMDRIVPDKIFATTELAALLENPRVTAINGIAKEIFFAIQRDLPANDVQGAMLKLVRAGFLVKLGGEVVNIDGEKLSSLQRIEKVYGPQDIRQTLWEAAEPLKKGTISTLSKIGYVTGAISLYSACLEAKAAMVEGDKEKAKLIMAEWGTKFAGGWVLGEITASAVGAVAAPLLTMGPWGWAGWTVLTLGTAMLVGMVGEEAIGAMFDPFETDPLWNAKTTPRLAERDDALGLAFRYALSQLDPMALVFATPPNPESLALYNPATGTGTITSDWIKARAQMMAAFVAYRAQGGDDDHVYSNQLDLAGIDYSPDIRFGILRDIVFSDLARGTDGDLRVDGQFNHENIDPNYIRFGDGGANTLRGGNATDKLFGEGGNDTLEGLDGNDILGGGGGNDTLYGGSGSDSIDGGADDDQLIGGDGDDTLFGGQGNDILEGGKGRTESFGGVGNDTYRYTEGDGPLVIKDVSGNDRISAIMDGGNRIYVLGVAGLARLSEDLPVWIDSHGVRFVRDDQGLQITMEDGGHITVLEFQDGDFGINLPGEGPNPPGGTTYNVGAVDRNVQYPEYPASLVQIEQMGWYTGNAGSLAGWFSPSAYFHRTDTEVINVDSALNDNQSNGYSNVFTRGGMGDSFITGDDGANSIIDDFAWWNTDIVHANTTWHIGVPSGIHPITDKIALGVYGGYAMADVVGNDRIDAGRGNDYVLTRGGDDTVFAGAGNDIVLDSHTGWAARRHESYTYGITTAEGYSFYYTGTEWLDEAEGRSSNDVFFGEAGDDWLGAHGGRQVMDGGADNDTLIGGADSDVLIGGEGNDQLGGDIFWLEGRYASDVARYGNDYLDGGAGNDMLYGGGGKDTLIGGAGDDLLQGDLLFSATLGPDPAAIHDADEIRGDAGNDTIYGGGGNDVVDGGADNDTIYGGAGNDFIGGGSGNDQIFGDDETDVTGDDEIHGGDGEDVIDGRAGVDLISGDAGNDIIRGGKGDDTLIGGADDDQLFGDGGDDSLWADGGDDELHGGAGNDSFIVTNGAHHVVIDDTEGLNALKIDAAVRQEELRLRIEGGRVFIDYSPTNWVEMSAETFVWLQTIDFASNDGPKSLDSKLLLDTYQPPVLSDGAIYLTSGAGTDQVSFLGIKDDLVLLYSGSQPNWIDLQSLTDRNVAYRTTSGSEFGQPASVKALVLSGWYRAEEGTYLRELRASYGPTVDLQAAAQSLARSFLGTDADETFIGGSGRDLLFGKAGDDVLQGGAQNDQLAGGAGSDSLSGGAGDDAYIYDAGDGADVIEDEGGTSDILVLGPGIAPENIELTKSSDGAVHIRIGAAEAGNSIVMRGIEFLQFANGTSWNAVQIDDHIVGNRAPRLVQGLANQLAAAGSVFSFTIPVAAFHDPDPGDSLAYDARLATGEPLPAWLGFDAATRTFSGTPTASDLATFSLRVTAYDSEDLSASSDFSISVINSSLVGTNASERIDGTAFADRIDGLAGNDMLLGYGGDDTIYGGSGEDHLEGSDGADMLVGGDGDDYLAGQTGADTLVGGEGHDQLYGGAGADVLNGGEGDDQYVIDFGDGSDVISDSGGSSDELAFVPFVRIDSFSYAREGDALRASLISSPGNDVVIEGWFSDPANQVEYWYAAGSGSFWTAADINARVNVNVAPTLTYNLADLAVVADRPFTYVVAAITFADANPTDTLTYSARLENGDVLPAWLQFNPQTRTFLGTAPGGFDSRVTVRLRATDTGSLFAEDVFDISIDMPPVDGSSAGDEIMGGAGAEEIRGLAGGDEIHGGAGADTLIGGRGDDRLFGGEGRDTFVFSRGDNHDVISFAENPAGDADTLLFTEGINPWSDIRFQANMNGDVIIGLRGSDGSFDDDSITLEGFLSEENADRRLQGIELENYGQIYSAATIDNQVSQTTEGDDYLRGSDWSEALFGNGGNDKLFGLAGDDLLDGGTGNDTLDGGAGDDQLQGGQGNDTFRARIGGGADVIADSAGADDVVEFAVGISVGDLTVTESAAGLEVTIGAAQNGDHLLIENWARGGEAGIDRFRFADGTSLDRAGIDALNHGNHGPRSGPSIARQDGRAGQAFTYVLPATALADADAGDTLTLVATRDNGDPLPAWLTFNPATRTFSGTPSTTDETLIDVRVTATDAAGLTAILPLQFGVRVRIDGTSGANSLYVLSPAGAEVFGLGGNDHIEGSWGNDELNGGDGNDEIIGGGGVDIIVGGTGNDTIYLGGSNEAAGNATVRTNLGDGSDRIEVSYVEDGQVYEFGTGINASYVRANMRLNDSGEWILPYNPANAADQLTLVARWFEPGYDVRESGATLRFADGSQYQVAQWFTEINRLGSGNDNFIASDSNPYHGGDGNDALIAGTFDEVVNLFGDAGDDSLQGWWSSGAILDGGAGDDRLYDSMNSDTLIGGDGNDILNSFDGSDLLLGGGGNDRYSVSIGDQRNGETTHISDTSGFDLFDLWGYSLTDYVFTRVGDDLRMVHSYLSNPGIFVFDNWFAGPDFRVEQFDLQGSYTADQVESMVTGANIAPGVRLLIPDSGVRPSNVYSQPLSYVFFDTGGNLTYSATLTSGAALPSWLTMTQDPDAALFGTPAAANAGTYNIRVTATDGSGLSVFQDVTLVVNSTVNNGSSSSGTFNGTSSADIYFGNGGDDTISGANGNDQLYGGAGNDAINGGAGDDTIVGGSGDDTLIGGAGINTYVFDRGDDADVHAMEATGTHIFKFGASTTPANLQMHLVRSADGSVEARIAYDPQDLFNTLVVKNVYAMSGGSLVPNANLAGYSFAFSDGTTRTFSQALGSLTATAGDDILLVSAAGSLNGGDGNDFLIGSSGTDQLTGGNGNDQLVGGAGVDTLTGGAGDDLFDVDSASDIVTESANQGNDTVNVSAATGFTGGVVNLSSFANVENLSIGAGFGVATLNGTSGANRITGNAGANRIDGGMGDDTLTGGGGSDTFAGFGLDTGNDVIAQAAGASDVNVLEYAPNIGLSQLMFIRTGNDLFLLAGAEATVRVQDFYAAANVPISRLSITAGGLQYNYTAAQLAAAGNGTNGGPAVSAAISDTNATVGTAFNHQFATNAFTDIESQTSLAYTAGLASGGALPSWLSFDATMRRFTGTPTGTATLITVRVTATDGAGLATFDDFVINVQGGAIVGTNGNDNLVGTAANDTIQGLGGDDTINGAGGADQMFGGSGNDAYTVDNVGDTVIENAGEGSDSVSSSVSFTLGAEVENLTLTLSGLTATGNGLANTLTGTTGGADTLVGNDGNDTLVGLGGNDTLNGGNGDDRLDGGVGNDGMTGGAGDDTYVVDSASDTITEAAGGGTDTVETAMTFSINTAALQSVVENLTLTNTGTTVITGTGNALNNVLMGSIGSNTLVGGAGNDTLNPGSGGTDILQGQTGDDTYIIDRTGTITITEITGEGTADLVRASVSHTLAANVENLILTSNGNIDGTGNNSNNSITGNSGNNRLNGGSGTDTLIGGLGDDTYVVDTTTDVISELAGEGTDTVESSATFSINPAALQNVIENLTLTNTGTTVVTGTGNALNNVLTGSAGSNTLLGGAGNDTLSAGSAGTDTLQGQTGDDTYIIDRTGISISEATNEGIDTVRSSITFTLATNFENLTLTNTGTTVITGTGTSGDNVLTGSIGSNTLVGGGGNDTLDAGSAGTDILQGQAGNDTYIVDRTSTLTLTEVASEGTDTVRSSVATFTLATNFENLTLTGIGNITGNGNGVANVITGNSGNNTIDAGAGDDTINGGGGDDSITGGLGADTYQYTSGGGNDAINNVAADSLIDRLVFTDFASGLVNFSKGGTGNVNLIMTVTGGNTITVSNWFSATANRLDFVNFTDRQVTATEIDNLVNSGGGHFLMSGPSPTIQDTMRARARELLGGDVVDTYELPEVNLAPVFAEPTLGPPPQIASDAVSPMTPASKLTPSSGSPVWQPLKPFAEQSNRTSNGVSALLSIDHDVISTSKWHEVRAMLGGEIESETLTLGEKSTKENPLNQRWMPIKSFLNDEAEVGVNRLVDAMSSFGSDPIIAVCMAPATNATNGAFEQLAASQDLLREITSYRGEHGV